MKTRLEYIFKSYICLLAILIGTVSVSAKSLWPRAMRGERSMFSDRVAHQRGDIITVVVSESTTRKNRLETKGANKDASILNTFTTLLYANSDLWKHNGTLPSTNVIGDTNFKGKGEVDDTMTLNATFSVTIIDELPNGNLILEGVRKLAFSEESEFAVLRGVVRPDDISTDNTIRSHQIGDLQLDFLTEGKLTAAQRKGWLMKFNDWATPF